MDVEFYEQAEIIVDLFLLNPSPDKILVLQQAIAEALQEAFERGLLWPSTTINEFKGAL